MSRTATYPRTITLRGKRQRGVLIDTEPRAVRISHESERYYTGVATQDAGKRDDSLWPKSVWEQVKR